MLRHAGQLFFGALTRALQQALRAVGFAGRFFAAIYLKILHGFIDKI
ncbi:hypothetical protein GCWU000246_00979 [Jonquetella anthropi E3_33 E1]|nr:hypothetical protein GCWU000246_00979 [Jonquetella anthropi E3_33 E1]